MRIPFGVTCVATASCLLLAGCPGESSDSLDGETVIGGSNDRIVMSHDDFKYPPTLTLLAALLNHSDSSPFVTMSYAAIDVHSGGSTRFDAPETTGTSSGLTDGHWFVQQDSSTGEIAILDLDDGSVLQLTPEDFGLESFRLRAVNKPLLGGADYGSPPSAHVVNVQSRQVVTSVQDINTDAMALSQNHVLLYSFPAIGDVDFLNPDSLPDRRIVLANLNTGQQSILAEQPDPQGVLIEGDYGYWVEGEGENVSDVMTVHQVTLSTGETKTLFSFSGLGSDLNSGDDYNYVIGFTPSGILVGSTHLTSEKKEVITHTWHPRDGQPVRLVEDVHNQADGGLYDFNDVPPTNTHPTGMVGHFVVYFDAPSAQWRLFDVESGENRAFVPFP